jgi:hypothetical protein
MKLNSNITIKGDRVILVPYRREHVERYHEWMVSNRYRRQHNSVWWRRCCVFDRLFR